MSWIHWCTHIFRNLMLSGRILLGIAMCNFFESTSKQWEGTGASTWFGPCHGTTWFVVQWSFEGNTLFFFSMDILRLALSLLKIPLRVWLGVCHPWKTFWLLLMFICVIWISANLENDGKNLQDCCIVGWIFLHWLFNVKAPTWVVLIPNGLTFPWWAKTPRACGGLAERSLSHSWRCSSCAVARLAESTERP